MVKNSYVRRIVSGAALFCTPAALVSNTVSAKKVGSNPLKTKLSGELNSLSPRHSRLEPSENSVLMKMKKDLKSSSEEKGGKSVVEKLANKDLENGNLDPEVIDSLLKSLDLNVDEMADLLSHMDKIVRGSGALDGLSSLNFGNDKVTLSVGAVKKDKSVENKRRVEEKDKEGNDSKGGEKRREEVEEIKWKKEKLRDDLVEAYKVARKEGICSFDFLDGSVYEGGEDKKDKHLKEIFGSQHENGSVKFVTLRDTSLGSVVGQFQLVDLSTLPSLDGVSNSNEGDVCLDGWATSESYFNEGFKLILSKLSESKSVRKVVVMPGANKGAKLKNAVVSLGKSGIEGFPKFTIKERCDYKKILRSTEDGGIILRSGVLVSLNGGTVLDIESDKVDYPVSAKKVTELMEEFATERKKVPFSRVPDSGAKEITRAYSNKLNADLDKDSKYKLIDFVDSVFVEYHFEKEEDGAA